MTSTVVNKTGFALLSPDTLIESVRRIESAMPGWWWSISQKKDAIFVNMGPGRNCPHFPDVEYAKTREGDSGRNFEHMIRNDQVDEADFLHTLDTFILSFAPTRKLGNGVNKPIQIVTLGIPTYRHQSESDLKALLGTYLTLLSDIGPIVQRGHRLEEIYLGSCDLSADCSLRGKRVDESDFDITVDLTGQDPIAEALVWAFHELRNDALTPRR